MYCQHCGTQLVDGAALCHHCGNPPLRSQPVAAASLESDPAMRLLLPVGRSLWAVAAGYAGLFAVLGICAPVALILGIIALIDIKRHPEKHGKGRAIFAIVMGVLGIVVPILIMVAISINEMPRR